MFAGLRTRYQARVDSVHHQSESLPEPWRRSESQGNGGQLVAASPAILPRWDQRASQRTTESPCLPFSWKASYSASRNMEQRSEDYKLPAGGMRMRGARTRYRPDSFNPLLTVAQRWFLHIVTRW